MPKVASSSLKMQRKCGKEKDKDFCTDETKKEMLRDEYPFLKRQHPARLLTFLFPKSAYFSEKKHLYFYRIRQKYHCGKKNAFLGKKVFHLSKKAKGEKDYEEQQPDQCSSGS